MGTQHPCQDGRMKTSNALTHRSSTIPRVPLSHRSQRIDFAPKDRYDLDILKTPWPLTPHIHIESLVVREVCQNTMLFPRRVGAEEIVEMLHRTQGEPWTPKWAKRVSRCLALNYHRTLINQEAPSMFVMIDRMTALGRVGGLDFVVLGIVAGAMMLACREPEYIDDFPTIDSVGTLALGGLIDLNG